MFLAFLFSCFFFVREEMGCFIFFSKLWIFYDIFNMNQFGKISVL